jgi:hypothetical protein
MRTRPSILLLLAGLLLLPGCGGPKMAYVTGKVTCKGKPVKEAAVTFNPAGRFDGDKEPGKPATGFTDEEGKYVLATFKKNDGALIGKHQVTVTLDDTNPARCKRSKSLAFEVKAGPNECNIELDE